MTLIGPEWSFVLQKTEEKYISSLLFSGRTKTRALTQQFEIGLNFSTKTTNFTFFFWRICLFASSISRERISDILWEGTNSFFPSRFKPLSSALTSVFESFSFRILQMGTNFDKFCMDLKQGFLPWIPAHKKTWFSFKSKFWNLEECTK